MLKIKPLFIVAVAVAGISMISNDCFAQGCDSCGQAGASFSYPNAAPVYSSVVGDCGAGGCGLRGRSGGHMDELKAKYAHAQKINSRVVARNEAWPMPFDCADRQLYFSIWDPMIDQGFEEQCVLNSAHFDAETNELNQFGRYTVAGIMQNMPTTRRMVFIHRDSDQSANDKRMSQVKSTIDTFYGQMGPAKVAFSTKLPVTLRGDKAAAISQLSAENRPTPVIPISSGETVSSSVGN